MDVCGCTMYLYFNATQWKLFEIHFIQDYSRSIQAGNHLQFLVIQPDFVYAKQKITTKYHKNRVCA